METTETRIDKGIEYDFASQNDKHYFAGYFNLAYDHIEQVFKLFADRFKVNGDLKPIIDTAFNDMIAPSEYQLKIDFLKQYFPVVHFLDKETEGNLTKRKNDFKKGILLLINAISDYRNYYTHYFHKEINSGDKLYTLLDALFHNVIQLVKKQRMKTDATRLLLKKGLKEELAELKQQRKNHLLQKQQETKKRVDVSNEALENGVLNDAFYHLLFKNEVNQKYKSKDHDTNNISESGILFLLSMFLTKKESEELRANIRGYKAKLIKDNNKPIDKRNNSLKYMATHWVYNYLAVKPIKHRVNSTFFKETFLLQIADELSKVPDDLYQAFSKEKRDQFIEDVNEYFKDSEESIAQDKALVIHSVIRKRYEDKFNYFVLRYLDEFVDFPSIRFQIHLGNYIHDSREKKIGGTNYVTQRVIKEKINVFGKLSEVTTLKADYSEILNNKEDTQIELFPNPSYNFVDNNIPIHVNLNNKDIQGASKMFSWYKKMENLNPKPKRREGKPDKKEIAEPVVGNTIKMGKPIALLSLNELQALLYEHLVNKKSGKEIERMIIEKLVAKFNTIQNYKTEQNLPTSKITKKLRKSSHTDVLDSKKLLSDIAQELAITQQKLQLIQTNKNELVANKRKFIFTTKELGQEATWLANDIKRIMPKEARENWKGYQHSQLQKSLAYYTFQPQDALNLLKEQWDLNKDYLFNSWITTSFKEKTFDRFYKNYLIKRNEYFERILNQSKSFLSKKKLFKKFCEQQFIWNIFTKRLYNIRSTENQINELLLKPLVFDRGIFDSKPTYIKGENIAENPEAYADWYRYIQDSNHQLQQFYGWDKDYIELFEYYKQTEEFVNNEYGLTEKQQLELLQRKWDKKIKKQIGQDLFLLLILQDVIAKTFGTTVNLQLNNFYFTQEERIEKQKKADEMSKRAKGDKSENIIKDDFIWSMTIPFKASQIEEDNVKLKDIGKFISLLKDEKVQRIFSYDTDKKWSKVELDNELVIYEKIQREEFLKQIHLLEKKILESYKFDGINHPPELQNGENPNFKKYIANGWLKGVSQQDIDWLENQNEKFFESDKTFIEFKEKSKQVQNAFLLIYLRNKFAHNQLPIEHYFKIIQEQLTKNVAKTILQYTGILLNY